MPSLEIHIPISPRPFFFNRVRYIARSIRSLGADYANARVVVTVGDLAPPQDLDARMPWARPEGLEWRWLNRYEFARWQNSGNCYAITMMERFREGFSADYVIIADADILFMRPIDDLLALLADPLDVGGVMTHVPPFRAEDHATMWRRLFEAFGLPEPFLECEHSGFGDMYDDPRMRCSPAYFNSGMLIGRREAMNRMATLAMPALHSVRGVEENFYFDQLAFTLMMYKARVNKRLIPMRFNFPNQESFERRFPEDLADVAVVHFLRTDRFHRDRVFASRGAVEAFIARTDLTGTNERVRARIAELHPSIPWA